MAIIYRTHNLINGKMYVGSSKYNRDSYLGSGKLIKRAIKKYGKESVRKEILEECQENDIKEREEYWLKKYDCSTTDEYYNLISTSEGGNTMEGFTETAARIIHMKKGRKGKLNSFYGKKHSKDKLREMVNTRKNNGSYIKGQNHLHTPENKEKAKNAIGSYKGAADHLQTPEIIEQNRNRMLTNNPMKTSEAKNKIADKKAKQFGYRNEKHFLIELRKIEVEFSYRPTILSTHMKVSRDFLTPRLSKRGGN